MIIWSGRGILSVLVLIISIIACIYILPKECADYGFAVSFLVAGLFSWFFGKRWNSSQRILKDEKTGQRIVLKNRHTLFWIPMQYIGYIFILVGIVILFQSSVLLGMVSIVMPMVLLYKDFFSTNLGKQKIREERILKESRVLKEEKQELQETEEAERTGIGKDRENPSRFMPKP